MIQKLIRGLKIDIITFQTGVCVCTVRHSLFVRDLCNNWVMVRLEVKITLIPHGSVAASIRCNISLAIISFSAKISVKLLVPRIVRKVVEANCLVLLE